MKAPPLEVEKVHAIVSRQGRKGRALTQHLSKKRHAATEELARLLHIKSPRLSLYIGEKVNPAARRIIDRDLVVSLG